MEKEKELKDRIPVYEPYKFHDTKNLIKGKPTYYPFDVEYKKKDVMPVMTVDDNGDTIQVCPRESKNESTSTKLNDSGNRTEFETGSHKDLSKGRGRFDLIPLGTLSEFVKDEKFFPAYLSQLLLLIDVSIRTEEVTEKKVILMRAIRLFIKENKQYTPSEYIRELAILYEAGASKYAERDWEKGRPMEVFINSALRHLFKFLNGDTDEKHDIAFIWNLFSCIDTIDRFPKLAYTYKAPTSKPDYKFTEEYYNRFRPKEH